MDFSDEQPPATPEGRRARLKIVPLPPQGIPDQSSPNPQQALERREGLEVQRVMAKELHEGLTGLAKRELCAGALAAALMADGLDGKRCSSRDVALLLGLCPDGKSKAARAAQETAAAKVRAMKKKALDHYHCEPGHLACVPCALSRGRRLVTALKTRVISVVSPAEFDAAREIDPE